MEKLEIPEGYALVPLVPTPEMVRAACAVTCVECHADCDNGPYAKQYQAMVEAAQEKPETPAEPEPDPVYIDPNDEEAWAKVDAHIREMTVSGGDLDVDWMSVQWLEASLQVNAIVSIEVHVDVYRG